MRPITRALQYLQDELGKLILPSCKIVPSLVLHVAAKLVVSYDPGKLLHTRSHVLCGSVNLKFPVADNQ